jgi:hypothetical protein
LEVIQSTPKRRQFYCKIPLQKNDSRIQNNKLLRLRVCSCQLIPIIRRFNVFEERVFKSLAQSICPSASTLSLHM